VSDLILAAVAHHQVAVMYYDRDFDRIAEISGQPVEWVAPAGAVA
jgi:predicted nucleic acid-binding protein